MEYFKVYRGTILINKMKMLRAIHIKIKIYSRCVFFLFFLFFLPLFDVKV